MSQDYQVNLVFDITKAQAAIKQLQTSISNLQKTVSKKALGTDAVKEVAYSYNAADIQCQRWSKTLRQKVAASYTYADVAAQQHSKILKQQVAQSYAQADAQAQAYYKNTLTRIQQLGKADFGKLTSGQIQVITNEINQLNKSLAGIKNNLTTQEYTYYSKQLDKASTSLRKLKNNADFGYSALTKFWERFGKVALGFSVMYTGMRLVSSAFMQFTQILKEGVQQAGEMVALQSKMALWASLASDGMLDYSDAFDQARGQTEALADASVTAIASLDELSAAYDELGQTAVGLSKDMIPAFTSLVDFTILIAKTTDSSMKQVRQELQALMSGQVRTTNVLIRTAEHLGMISEEDIENLKKQENSYEIIVKLIQKIDENWGAVKEKLIMADVNTGMKMWYDTLVRIVSKSEEIASQEEGVQSIFGATAYEHFSKLQTKLQSLGGEYSGALKAINAGFDTVLTSIENLVDGTLRLIDNLYEVRELLSFGAIVGGGAITARSIASLVGVGGPIGLIAAGVLAVDQLIKKLASLKDSPLWSAMSMTWDGLVRAWQMLQGERVPEIFGGGYTTKGLIEHGDIDDVNAMQVAMDNLRSKIKKHYDALVKLQNLKKKDPSYATILDPQIQSEYSELADLQNQLSQLKTKYNDIINPTQAATQALQAFYKETDNIEKTLKALKFDPVKELFTAVEAGDTANLAVLKKLAEQQVTLAKAETERQLAAVKTQEQTPQQIALVTALRLELAKQEKVLKDINSAEEDAYAAKQKQLAPLNELKEKHKELMASLHGESAEYNIQKTIKETIAEIEENTGKTATAALKKEIEQLVRSNAELEKQLTTRKDLNKEWSTYYDDILTENMAIEKKTIEGISEAQKAFYNDLYMAQTTEKQRARDALTDRLNTYKNMLDEMGVAEEDFNALRDALWEDFYDKYEKREKTWRDGIKEGMEEIADKAGYTYENVKSTVTGAFNSMTDALTTFVTTGKLSFSDFADSIIEDLVRMQIQASITEPLASGLSGLLDFGASSVLGFLGLGSSTSGASSGQIGSSSGAMMMAANGGVFRSPSLHEYVNTVQTSPKLFTFAQGGVFAEADPEAVMPLTRTQDNKLGVHAVSSPANVTVNVINESGTPMAVKKQTTSYDLQEQIITVWLDGYQRDVGNLRTVLNAR